MASATCLTAGALAGLLLATSGCSRAPSRPPSISRVAFSRGSGLIAAADSTGRVSLWGAPDWKPEHSAKLKMAIVHDLQISPDERSLAAAGSGLVRLDISADRAPPQVLREPSLPYGSVDYSPDGAYLLAARGDSRIELLHSTSGRSVQSFCCSTVYGEARFSPNGRLFASAGHWPRVWDLSDGSTTALSHSRMFMALGPVVFHKAGWVAMGSQDGRIRIWNPDGRLSRESPARPEWVETISASSGGHLIAYTGRGGPIRTWDVALGTIATIETEQPSSNLAFSPNGLWLAFGTAKNEVLLFDTAKREVTVRLPMLF